MYTKFQRPSDDVFAEAVANIRGLKAPVRVLRVDFEAGTEIGENFASAMKKAKVTSESDDANSTFEDVFMCKFAPLDAQDSNWFKRMKLFERESEFYSRLLPPISETLTVNGFETPFARCAHAGALQTGIIMENLKASGFALNPAQNCLPLDKLEIIVDDLAPFHAVGHKMYRDLGDEEFRRRFPMIAYCADPGLFCTDDADAVNYMKSVFRTITNGSIKIVEDDLAPETLRRLKRFVDSDEIFERAGDARKRRGVFMGVAHGDTWNNNIMFNGDGDVQFVDLQNACFSRPVLDLAILLFQSVTPEVRRRHLSAILRRYHDKLCRVLRQIGCETVYGFETFMADFWDLFPTGFAMAMINIATVMKAVDFEDLVKDVSTSDEDEEDKSDLERRRKIARERILDVISEAEKRDLF